MGFELLSAAFVEILVVDFICVVCAEFVSYRWLYQLYLNVLEEELVPAMGCTEPIAVAYGAAKAREVLGKIPDRITIEASGSIIKNVKS